MSSTEPPASGSSGGGAAPSSGASSGSSGGAPKQPSPRPQGIFARSAAAASRLGASSAGRLATTGWRRRRGIFFGVAVTFSVASYLNGKAVKAKADYVHNDSWLLWKLHDGAIVEARSPQLLSLLRSANPGEDAPAVMELYDAIKSLKLAQNDPRIRGLIADFSALHAPSDSGGAPLGLAQIEELTQAIHEFKSVKNEALKVRADLRRDLQSTLAGGAEISGRTKAVPAATIMSLTVKGASDGKTPNSQKPKSASEEAIVLATSEPGPETAEAQQLEMMSEAAEQLPATIAWTDTFTSQGQYLLASAFDHVYIQPSGSVPLVGMSSTLPFFKRALDWLGIELHAETRRDHKSFLSQFTEDGSLTEPQKQDAAALLGDLNRGMAHAIGVSRFPDMNPDEAADKVIALSMRGPFSASEAAKEGLVTGALYPFELRAKLGESAHFKGFPHYASIYKEILEQNCKKGQYSEVAVVYLKGTISNASGPGSAAEAIKGLKEAGEDERIKSVVLRIDSGGGDVVASDSIWAAVRRCQTEHKKPVIASYGNVTASGGVYGSAAADYIMACEQTITGSIGVASLRPTFTRKLFDRVGLQFQSFFTGSRAESSLQKLDEEAKRRSSEHIDEMYEQFKQKVCDGRGISPDVIEELAGGRVYSGLSAWLRCKSDEDLVRESAEVEAEASPAEGASDVQAQKDAPPRRSLRLSWRTESIEKPGDFSALQIVPAGATPEPSSQSEAVASSESSTAADEVAAQPAAAAAVKQDQASDDQLAATAHEEAVAEKEQPGSASSSSVKEAEGPYGRGLVDSIGGLYDAVCIAMSIEVQRDAERRVVEENLTLEAATEAALKERGAEISVDGDGNQTVLSTDLRAVRYPRQLTFLQRVRKMSTHTDPSFSVLQPLSALGHALAESAAQSFVRHLCSSEAWRRALQHELAKQTGVRAHDAFAASMRP